MDKTKMAIEVFDKYALQYQEKFMDLELYNDTFDVFCQYIPTENATVLDVACGPGNITAYLLRKRPDFKILGIDLAQNMLNLAQINNPTAEFQLMDCRDIALIGKKYNAIMCGFCLPYLSREEAAKLIVDAYRLLEHEGVLYLSTMEDDYSKSGLKKSSSGSEIYMHYHPGDELVDALNEIGFKIIDLQRKDFPTNDGSKTTDLVIIAQK
ncbi:class I SAM-dependent methyltransferase [Runella sp.]|uniref:class I SAM-dependent methyltransferase n=1 Tax=Runella sp. TaxID=1960881 RepID=UPI003D0C9363